MIKNHPLSPWQILLLASRPKTLPAAAAPVIIGTAVAAYSGEFQLLPALATLVTALLLQIGANLANDAFDYLKGADTSERLGPMRVTQAGLMSAGQVLAAMWFVFGLSALLGIYLIWISGWPILVIGLLSIAGALAYTGGPIPYGYYGLGDIFVFFFFGPLAVCGTTYIQTGQIASLAFLASIPVGFLVTDILVVNNLRDIETDRTSNKYTLAVRLGEHRTRQEYAVLIAIAYLVPPMLGIFSSDLLWTMLSWISMILLPWLFKTIFNKRGRKLNPALAGTGQLVLFYSILFSAGLLLAGWLQN